MREMVRRMLGKKCCISTFQSEYGCVDGVIEEVTDGAILVKEGELMTVINLNFVVTIEELPVKKKKKSEMLD